MLYARCTMHTPFAALLPLKFLLSKSFKEVTAHWLTPDAPITNGGRCARTLRALSLLLRTYSLFILYSLYIVYNTSVVVSWLFLVRPTARSRL